MDIEDKKRQKAVVFAVARAIYAGYCKDTAGEPKRLSELSEDDQKIWVRSAKRAISALEKRDTERTIRA